MTDTTDFKLPDDAEFDFSEWKWGNIIDEAKSLLPGIEEAFLTTFRDDLPAMIHYEDGKLTLAVGLPLTRSSDWVWATVGMEALVEDLADPLIMEPSDRKDAADILRKMADRIQRGSIGE